MKFQAVIIVLVQMVFLHPNPTEASTKTMLALGDSITAGAPAFRSPAEGFPEGRGNPESQYSYWLHLKHPDWRILNRGISGQTTRDIAARLERELNQSDPHLVILMAGVNDIFRGYEQAHLRLNLQRMYEKIQARKIPLMVLTILPYQGLTPKQAEVLRETNRWIESYAAQYQLGFCDTYQVMRSSRDPQSLSSTTDGLHPDPAGYRVMGEAIAASLEQWPLFERMSRS